MMPLTMVKDGEQVRVAECRANSDAVRHLEELGVLPGRELQMVSIQGGDVIIRVQESRLAINRGMASNIMVEEAEQSALQREPMRANHEEEHLASGGVGLHSKRHNPSGKKEAKEGFRAGRK